MTARTIVSRSPASKLESEPSIAVAPDGQTIVVAWTARAETDWVGEGAVGYSFSTDGGVTWTPPRAVNLDGRETPFNVRVAADASGGFALVWLARSFFNPDAIAVARASPGDTTFGEATAVTDADVTWFYDLPALTTTAQATVLAAFTQDPEELEATDCQESAVARSRDGGTWSRVTVAPCRPDEPVRGLHALCTGGDERVWLASAVGTGEELRIELFASEDEGMSWTAVGTASAPGEPVAFDPISCVADRDQVWVVYGLSEDPQLSGGTLQFAKLDSVVVAHSSDAGGSFRRMDALAHRIEPFGMHPQIARGADGAIHVFYLAGAADGDEAGVLRRATAVDDSFGPPVQVDAPFRFEQMWGGPGFLGDYLGVAAAGTRLVAAYAVADAGTAHVAFMSIDP